MATPILSLTLDPITDGEKGGYSNDEIFLLITGKRAGIYHFLNWATGTFEKMSEDHNTRSFNLLALPQENEFKDDGSVATDDRGVPIQFRQKYADYGKSLNEVLALQSVIDNDGRIPIPTPIEGARVYLSFLKPIFLHINSGGTPAEPADQDWKDPNYATIWDKFEFTSDDPNDPQISLPQLWSNTSCVDFVGIPLEFTLEHGDGENNVAGPQGFKITATDEETRVFEPTDDPLEVIKQKFITGINNAQIEDVDEAAVSTLFTPYRIFSPKVHGSHFEPRFGDGGDYMDNYINFCWGLDFSNREIRLSNFVNVRSDEHEGIVSQNSDEIVTKGCKWEVTGKIVNDEMIFHLVSLEEDVSKTPLTLPTKADQSPIAFTIPKPTSNQVLSQGGPPFTKPDFNDPPDDKPEFNKNYLTEIDGDIKNQVSSAMNRTVMHLIPDSDTELWSDPSQYYELNGLQNQSDYKPNFYSKFLHPLCHQNKCYALPYDDKHDQQVQLNIAVSTAADNPIVETKVILKAFYKRKAAVPISTFTHELNNDDFSVGIEPNPDLGEGMATIWIESDKDIDLAWVAYEPDVPTDDPNLFPSSLMEKVGDRFEVNFIPASLLKPEFKFWIKYHVVGDAGDSIFPPRGDDSTGIITYEVATEVSTSEEEDSTTGTAANPGVEFERNDPIAEPVVPKRENFIMRLIRILRERFGGN